MRIIFVLTIWVILIVFQIRAELIKNDKIESLEKELGIHRECIQSVKNSLDVTDYGPGPLGYSICDITPFRRPCPCSGVEL